TNGHNQLLFACATAPARPAEQLEHRSAMSTRQSEGQSPTVAAKQELIDWIARGEKPAHQWRIGTEHEKFVFATDTRQPVPYDGPAGIKALMAALIDDYRWEPIVEEGNVIALRRPRGEGSETISLEPGGQFELSGAPVENLHETCAEAGEHLRQCLAVGERLGIGFLGLGFTPDWSRDQMPMMPKPRFQVMKRYMPQVGANGLDMMFRTTTIQVNLDFASEPDMVAKLRASLALQPLATALFASSPFSDGDLSGFKSLRSEVWRDTDRNRTGMLPFVFDEAMGYEAYVDYALDVPMYFVFRDGTYIDASGRSFRDFLDGRLDVLPGERPTLDDWSDHLTTIFPEARLKRFIEMRGADGGPWRRICALPAFWVGLLYDETALCAVGDLIRPWTADERQDMRDQVPRLGLQTPVRGGTLQDVAKEAVAIATAGLKRRARINSRGDDETMFLQAVEEAAMTGQTPADELIGRFERGWNGDVAKIYDEYAY
ncbi:MAG: glutamate--cysteine ligase, partial [Pseudomonadota bacterium]